MINFYVNNVKFELADSVTSTIHSGLKLEDVLSPLLYGMEIDGSGKREGIETELEKSF
jgi:hypothetical protein